jgi:phosphoribosyl 1,2-cyclic phosphodiesterase
VRELLASVASPQWRRIYLTHLSRDCNSRPAIERALAEVRSTRATCEFAIVGADESTPFYDL